MNLLKRVEIDNDVSITYEVRSAAGVLQAPSTTAITITSPTGIVTNAAAPTATIVTGRYRYDFNCNEVGDWSVRVKTTGPRTSRSGIIRSTKAAQ